MKGWTLRRHTVNRWLLSARRYENERGWTRRHARVFYRWAVYFGPFVLERWDTTPHEET